MTPFELEKTLSNIKVTVDTREQATTALADRLSDIGFEYERKKLDFGDYSCKVTLPDDTEIDFSTKFAIERKMNIDELATCFTSQRKRFTAEFERAKEAGAKIYLLVENASFEKIIAEKYRSKVNHNALLASIFAFLARYNCQIVFCKPETSGRVIREILYREAKEHLQNTEVPI